MRVTPGKRALRGQAVVEFSIAISIFLLVTIGILDAARAVFQAHNLSRASEQLATDLATQFSLAGTDAIAGTALLTPVSASNPITPLQDSSNSSSGAFAPAWTENSESPYSVPAGCTGSACTGEEMDNRGDNPYAGNPGTPSIYVCGVPNLESPDVIKVTLRGQFTPVAGYFVGGKTMYISESATVLTPLGEQAGSTLMDSSSCLP